MSTRLTAAIVGSGNIGTDLMYKLQRSDLVEARWMVGVDPDSEGLKRAKDLGLEATHDGIDWLLAQPEKPDLLFEATSAYVYRDNAPRYREAGIKAIDLTPAAIGPYVVPAANMDTNLVADDINLVTSGGQATIPIVHAIASVVPVPYAEIVASVSSSSAGPGTRNNIDEFTRTTAKGIEVVGGVERGKAIIILNPADPPPLMRNTVFCSIPEDADTDAIATAILKRVDEVAQYVPGYRIKSEPQFDGPSDVNGGQARVAVFIEVEGAGDFFPPYAGNLDIMTAAAVRVGEAVAASRLGV
jgi:acetaldehyde dehydrogenase